MINNDAVNEFQSFISRNGEIAAQAILENLERYKGVQPSLEQSLAYRWQNLMKKQL